MAGHNSPVPSPEPEDHTGTENGSSDDGAPVELLVKGREKRATAGARMSMLLEKEGDDELELLFAEDEQEEDNEFEDDDADDASDVQLDSASSDDDQGPAKGDDDLEGEKELQRQTRVERQKKRKAQDNFLKPGALKKRAKLVPKPEARGAAAAPTTPAPRPKKKSERVSWLPAAGEGPVRASSRKATVKNKEIMHTRLVASEKRRIQQLQVMKEADERREALKPKALTQAERMAEAARTERSNAKSLNRWEAGEKTRVEEQKAKLEALHNRQLTGPVLSWWSGMARWVDGKLKQVGWRNIKEAEAKSTSLTTHQANKSKTELDPHSQRRSIDGHDKAMQNEPRAQSRPVSSGSAPSLQNGDAPTTPQVIDTTVRAPEGFLDGIYDYANLPEQSGSNAREQPRSLRHDQTTPEPTEPVTPPPFVPEPVTVLHPLNTIPSTSPAIEYSARNMVILKDIDANVQDLPELQKHVLLKRRNGKPQKAARELCAITEQAARYRDPKTGLAYADSYAYKEIQKLANGSSRWSSLLGCYVGPTSSVARGVPDRFWKNT
ncbi:MAG: hypothetical protein Q9201_002644 [Fulgogasparrea decipioides]